MPLMIQITADGLYELYDPQAPLIDPEVRWGETGNATLRIGSKVAGIDDTEELLSWIDDAVFTDGASADPSHPVRSATLRGMSERIVIEASGVSQPITVRVMHKGRPELHNRLGDRRQ